MYFQSKITKGDGELAIIDLTSESQSIVGLVVRFLYTGRLLLSERNVVTLMKLCDRLEIPNAGEVCRGFMSEKNMNPFAAVTLYKVGSCQMMTKIF